MTDSDIRVLQEALENSREKSDVSEQLQTLSRLAQAYQADRQYRQALATSRQALDLVKDRENREERTLALANLGCVFWEMAQLQKAMDLFEEALTITEETGDQVGRAMLLTLLGISYWRKNAWGEAIHPLQQALKAFAEIKTVPSPAGDRGKYDGLQAAMERAVATLKNRIRIAREHRDPVKILLPAFAMLPLLLFTGRTGEIAGLLEEIIPLARKFKRDDILDALPKFQQLMKSD